MELVEVFSRHRQIELAFQYGSSVKKNQRRARDIDIAILLKSGVSPETRLDIQMAVADAAGRHFKKEVDIAILNNASPFLVYQVIKYGRLLYDPRFKARDFVVQTLTRYFDALQFYRFFNERLEKKLGASRHG